jgi:integrase
MSTPKKPLNDKGNLRIRFTHNNVRYTLNNLGKFGDVVAQKQAQIICDRISLDIALDRFFALNNEELAAIYHPSLKQKITSSPDIVQCLKDRLSKKYHSTDKSLLRILEDRNKPLKTKEDAQEFIDWLRKERNLQASSLQRYLNTLKACSTIFKDIKIKNQKAKPMIKPFTKQQVKAILDWFKDTHYYNYVYFSFNTGMRPSEVIGLQWSSVDFINNYIVIDSVLARDRDNTSKRVRKSPKCDITRKFPMNEELQGFLKRLYAGAKDKGGLVFLSPTGTSIDDHNFTNRWWRKCLKECGINHIDFYNCRRTFISHFLESTKDVVKCASLTHGTNSGIKTIWDHYAGVINKVEVPELY